MADATAFLRVLKSWPVDARLEDAEYEAHQEVLISSGGWHQENLPLMGASKQRSTQISHKKRNTCCHNHVKTATITLPS
jgi:hypothetical protein